MYPAARFLFWWRSLNYVLDLVSSNHDMFWQLAYPRCKFKSLKGHPIAERVNAMYYKTLEKYRSQLTFSCHNSMFIIQSVSWLFSVPPHFQYLNEKAQQKGDFLYFYLAATLFFIWYWKFEGTDKNPPCINSAFTIYILIVVADRYLGTNWPMSVQLKLSKFKTGCKLS